MKSEENIEREVEQTMQALDGIRRAEAGPFFYSKLRERLHDSEPQPDTARSLRLAFAAVALLLLVITNIFTLKEYDRQYGGDDSLRSEGLEALVDEYVPELPVLYELNVNEEEED